LNRNSRLELWSGWRIMELPKGCEFTCYQRTKVHL
jgi:hypothetical protein